MKYFIQTIEQTVHRQKAKVVDLDRVLTENTINIKANKTKRVFGKVSPGC